MRLGAFEIDEPVPELIEPHALVMLDPWIDVGGVGTLTLNWLEKELDAEDLGRVARPGNYFDFTRYRPTVYYEEGRRQVAVPNTYITFGHTSGGTDLLLVHLLEPHTHSDSYIESMVRLLGRFGVRRYVLLGSMYDYVPHTAPLLVTGSASGEAARDLERMGIGGSNYEGPTTITTLISQRAPELNMETMTLIVHLPQYTQLEEDYTGAVRLMDIVSELYGVRPDPEYYDKARQQLVEIEQALAKNPQLKGIVKELETEYQSGHGPTGGKSEDRPPKMSPEVERFLSEMEKRFRDDQQK